MENHRLWIGQDIVGTCITILTATLFLAGCNGAKKPANTEAEQQDYDYRKATQNYKIGINYLNNNEVHQAIEYLQTAAKMDPDNFRYHHGLGLAYSLNGQLDEALAELAKAVSINDQSSETHNLIGSILTEQGQYDEAIESLKKVILDKTYGQPQFAYFNLGLCMQKQGRIDEAAEAYKRAAQLDPKFYRAFVALGELHADSGEWNEALAYYQRAEPGFTDNVNMLFKLGQVLFKLKQFDQAKSYLAQVSILFPPPEIDKPTQDMLKYIEKYQREVRN